MCPPYPYPCPTRKKLALKLSNHQKLQKNLTQVLSDWVLIGTVHKVYGINGAVILKFLNSTCDILQSGFDIKFTSSSSSEERIYVIRSLTGRRIFLNGVNDRANAELLIDTNVWFRRINFPKLSNNEIYLMDLLGFEVINLSNDKNSWRVSGFSNGSTQLAIEIENNFNKKILVPFLNPLLQEIDEANKKIIMDFPSELELI